MNAPRRPGGPGQPEWPGGPSIQRVTTIQWGTAPVGGHSEYKCTEWKRYSRSPSCTYARACNVRVSEKLPRQQSCGDTCLTSIH
eukprot:gene5885-biopygen23797